MFRWFLTFGKAVRDPAARGALLSIFLLLITGIVFYMLVEHWTFVDALYFSVTTLATVGFGNPAPLTDAGKIFTVFFVISGVGMFLAMIDALGLAALKQDTPRLRRGRTNRAGEDEDAESGSD